MVWNPFRKKTPPKPVSSPTPKTSPSPSLSNVPPSLGGTQKTPSFVPAKSYPTSSGGGGGGSSPSPNVPASLGGTQPTQPTFIPQPTNTPSTSQQDAARKAAELKQQQIIVKASGGVQTGYGRNAVTSIGDAQVPGTNLSANKYRRQIQQQAVQQGLVKQENVNRTTITITPEVKQEVEKKSIPVNQPATQNLPNGNLPTFNDYIIRPEDGMTRTDLGKTNVILPQVYTEGTIYQTQTGTTTFQGRQIPITKTFVAGSVGVDRDATTEETKQLSDVIKSKAYEDTALSETLSSNRLWYGEKKGSYQKFASQEFIDVKATQDFFSKSGRVGEFTAGIIIGSIGTKGDVVRTGAIAGVTAGAGFGISALSKAIPLGVGGVAGYFGGATTATRVAGVTAKTIQFGKIGAGVYFGGKYVSQTATNIYQAPTTFEKGKITGRAASDIGAGIVGFRAGAKLYDVTEGVIRTRGRTFIDIPQGEYPTAPTSTQLKSFKKNLYPALGEKPGAFHTTGDVFWKGGEITPMAGTSELPGLYASTKISTPFSRITGSSSTTKFSITNWFKNSFSTPGNPGVAYLQPEGFRYSPYSKVTPYKIEGQTFKYAFNQQPKQGFADVPLLKTEIETIFRPGAGGYSLSSQGSYTSIKGVRVPIDSFVYDSAVVPSLTSDVIIQGGASSYGGYTTPSYSNPSAGITTIISSPTKTSSPTPTTYSSITPSYSSVSSTLPSYSISSVMSGSSGRSSSSKKSSASPSISKAYSSIVSSSKSSKPSKSVSKSSKLSSILPSSSSSSKSMPSYSYAPSLKKNSILNIKLGGKPKLKQPRGRFKVLGRRFGKFKTVGIGKTEQEAFNFGKKWVSKGLGATFEVPKAKARKLTGYRTKVTKEGKVLYIEPEKRRLKKKGLSSEIPEIMYYKKLKGGKKKR